MKRALIALSIAAGVAAVLWFAAGLWVLSRFQVTNGSGITYLPSDAASQSAQAQATGELLPYCVIGGLIVGAMYYWRPTRPPGPPT